jgi:hypothetical protein
MIPYRMLEKALINSFSFFENKRIKEKPDKCMINRRIYINVFPLSQ